VLCLSLGGPLERFPHPENERYVYTTGPHMLVYSQLTLACHA